MDNFYKLFIMYILNFLGYIYYFLDRKWNYFYRSIRRVSRSKSSFTSPPPTIWFYDFYTYNQKSNRYTFYQSTLDLFIQRYLHHLNEHWGEKSEEINSIYLLLFHNQRSKGKFVLYKRLECEFLCCYKLMLRLHRVVVCKVTLGFT